MRLIMYMHDHYVHIRISTFNSCNTGTSPLPDMSTLSPRAAEGGHIRQTIATVLKLLCNTFMLKV